MCTSVIHAITYGYARRPWKHPYAAQMLEISCQVQPTSTRHEHVHPRENVKYTGIYLCETPFLTKHSANQYTHKHVGPTGAIMRIYGGPLRGLIDAATLRPRVCRD
jgi:hypothetical protein